MLQRFHVSDTSPSTNFVLGSSSAQYYTARVHPLASPPRIRSFIPGVVVILAFQCITAFFDSINRNGKGIKWGLVCHTVAMFAPVTVFIAATLELHSPAYIDNREYPTGPLGFRLHRPDKLHSQYHVLLEQLAGGRPFGKPSFVTGLGHT